MAEDEVHNPPSPEQDKSLFRRRDADRKLPSIFSRLPYAQIIHISICVAIIVINILLLSHPAMTRFEYIFLDYFYSVRDKTIVDPSIVIVEIAEDGLQALGRWPWPRQYHAVIAHLLSEWGAKAVIFDVLFSEKSTDFDDGALREAIQKSGRVYLPQVLEEQEKFARWIKSLPEFAEHAEGIGHINVLPDIDGTIRRIEPYKDFAGEKVPHLALKIAADLQGEELDQMIEKLPVDDHGNLMVNWAGKWSTTFQHYSFVDLLKSYEMQKKGEKPFIDPAAIAGKVCLIGLTAIGHTDIKPNPLETLYPVLGVHANVINGMLIGEHIKPASFALNAVCLFFIGLLSSLIFALFRSVRSFLFGLGLGGVWFMITVSVFKSSGVWLFVFHELVLIITLYIISSVYVMIVRNRERLGLLFLATRDGLTGLYVIRHFRYLLNIAVIDAVKKKENLSVILMDVDHFKRINDTYGHQAGDTVLREISNIIQGTIRTLRPKMGDVVARYGGEEIIIYLKRCGLKEASEKIGEKIRTSVSSAVIHHKGLRISVSISLGVSTLHSSEHIPDIMVTRADKALYEAKRTGRNRVCIEIYEPEPDIAGLSNPPEKMVI